MKFLLIIATISSLYTTDHRQPLPAPSYTMQVMDSKTDCEAAGLRVAALASRLAQRSIEAGSQSRGFKADQVVWDCSPMRGESVDVNSDTRSAVSELKSSLSKR